MAVRETKITTVDTGNGPVALKPGQTVLIGRKWWGMCNRCHGLIRIDKPVIGSLHVCVVDDD